MSDNNFDQMVDVLVIGSGGGGMTAALTAQAAGLDTLVVEKSAHFGGSTALSGGGIWVPGAPSQRRENSTSNALRSRSAEKSWAMPTASPSSTVFSTTGTPATVFSNEPSGCWSRRTAARNFSAAARYLRSPVAR